MKKKNRKIISSPLVLESNLNIVSLSGKTLNENQDLFNKLTKRVSELELEIITEEKKLSNLLDFQIKKLRPLLFENAKLRLNLALALGNSVSLINYSKNQIENIREVIVSLSNQAFLLVDPTEEEELFYNEWSKITYSEEVDIQNKIEKEELSKKLSKKYDLEINSEDFDTTPEGLASFQARLNEEYEKRQDYKDLNKKKKTRKQIKEEENLKAEENIKNRSIRSIYIMLAKVLHPDAETDPTLKIGKEEIMKKVTFAYEQKDLPTLLKLEMEWVNKEALYLEKINENKLDSYINLLKERISVLEKEKSELYSNPRYSSLYKYSNLVEKNAIIRMKADIREQIMVNDYFKYLKNEINNNADKKQIIDFVNYYLTQINL
jgi:hypothetical protein